MTSHVARQTNAHEALHASEDRFRLLVESVRDYAIFMLDPEGRVATWNLGAERIKGYVAEEILGQHFARFYPPEEAAVGKPARELAEAAAHGRFEDEGWRFSKDGSRFWANVVITALRDEDGALVGFAKVTRDLSERKRAEEEQVRLAREQAARTEAEAMQRRTALLAEASRLLATSVDDSTLAAAARLPVPMVADVCLVHLLEHAPDGTGRTLRVAAVAHVDSAAEARLRALPPVSFDPDGLSPIARAIRTERADLVADPDLGDGSPVQSLVVAPLVARGRTLGALSLGYVDPRGRDAMATELLLADQLAGRVAIALDNARLYRHAQGAAEAQEATVRAQDAFLARASHELRTPLTAALGTTKILKRAMDGSLRESPEKLIDIAVRNLGVMAALVDDLLDASTLTADREPLTLEPIDLAETVRESVDVVAAEAHEKGVELRVDVEPGLTPSADRLKLEQVLVNLMANAIHFTPMGGEVRVEAERRGDQVFLRVRDTGEGLRPEHLESIFEPFCQVKRNGVPRPRGTGLGLTICRQIVGLHGGQIWAESDGPLRGSTLTVRLPAAALAGQTT